MRLEHFNKDEKEFVVKASEWIRRVYEMQLVKKTPFLSIREQALIQMLVNQYHDVAVSYEGGILHAERKRAIIYPKLMGEDLGSEISGLKITYPHKYTELTHRQVLGAMMSLNIDRSQIGDIIMFKPGEVYVAVCESFVDVFIRELQQIGKASVKVEAVDVTHYERIEQYETFEITVSSLRLDVVVAALIKQSRQEVSDLIKKGFVSRQFSVVQNHATTCQIEDVISIRKVGRFKLLEYKAITKSQRHRLIVGKIIS